MLALVRIKADKDLATCATPSLLSSSVADSTILRLVVQRRRVPKTIAMRTHRDVQFRRVVLKGVNDDYLGYAHRIARPNFKRMLAIIDTFDSSHTQDILIA